MGKVIATRTLANGNRAVTKYEDTVAPAVTDDSADDVVANITIWDVVDADGKLLTRYLCTDATAGAAVWKTVDTDTQTRTIGFIEEVITFTGTATKNLAVQLPANATPLYAAINLDVLVVCTTAVKIGVGTAADPDGYSKTGALTKNTKEGIKGALINAQVAAATTIQVTACDTAGALAGTADSGQARIRVYYELFDQLPNA